MGFVLPTLLLVISATSESIGIAENSSSYVNETLSSPRITVHPRNVTLQPRETAMFTCSAEGTPEPDIFWFKNGKRITGYEDTAHHIVSSSGVLHISGVRESDEGEYRCEASSSQGRQSSHTAFLRVIVLEGEFPQWPVNASVNEEGTVLLPCAPPVSRPPASVSWLKDGRPVDVLYNSHYRLMEWNLVVMRATPVQSGSYTCVATNGNLRRQTKPAYLFVGEAPRFIESLEKHYSVEQGDSLLLTCRAAGDPLPQFQWRKDDTTLYTSHKYVVERNSLQIKDLESLDSGRYSCVASNDIDTIKSETHVVVSSAEARFLEMPEDAEVAIGDSARFPCKAADPNTETMWLSIIPGKLDTLLKGHSEGRFSVTEEGTLVIADARVEDSGEYQCRIFSFVTNAENSLQVNLVVSERSVSPPPLIKVEPFDQWVRRTTDVLLPCIAEGEELPTVHWYFNHVPLSEYTNKRHMLLMNGSLHITQAQPEDSGDYTCVASNGFGHTSATCRLSVTSDDDSRSRDVTTPVSALPHPPVHLAVHSVGPSAVRLAWFPPVSRGDRLRYRVDYHTDGLSAWRSKVVHAADDSSDQIVAEVDDLHTGSNHQFNVRSCDAVGCGKPTELHYRVSTLGGSASEDEVQPKVELFAPMVVNSSAALFSWHVFDHPDSIIAFKLTLITVQERQTTETVTIQDHGCRSFLASTLRPATEYTISFQVMTASWESPPETKSLETYQAPPSAPPTHVTASLNGSTIWLSWTPPPAHSVNGILTGYVIMFESVSGRSLYNVSTGNFTSAAVQLNPGTLSLDDVIIRVAARSMAPGLSPLSQPVTVHIGGAGEDWWCRNYAWIIGVPGGIVWAVLFVILVLTIRRKYKKWKNEPVITFKKERLYHDSDVSNMTLESQLLICGGGSPLRLNSNCLKWDRLVNGGGGGERYNNTQDGDLGRGGGGGGHVTYHGGSSSASSGVQHQQQQVPPVLPPRDSRSELSPQYIVPNSQYTKLIPVHQPSYQDMSGGMAHINAVHSPWGTAHIPSLANSGDHTPPASSEAVTPVDLKLTPADLRGGDLNPTPADLLSDYQSADSICPYCVSHPDGGGYYASVDPPCECQNFNSPTREITA
uniref:Robo4 protein n=1 Tax=Isodiametra pulchra TaxID=504439 RepID=A0A2P1DV84_ISOPU|nr:Robo4 protein [Isodiametra pulchra]